jgi:hypothetical protein
MILGVGVLAARGEVVLSLDPVREYRIWLVREGPEQGLGYSSMKRISGSRAEGTLCYETRVKFLLWKSSSIERQASYCDCYNLDTEGWELVDTCP